MNSRTAILGAGNIGSAIARGMLESGGVEPGNLMLTRRKPAELAHMSEMGCSVGRDNIEAVKNSDVVIVAVEPMQANGLLEQITVALDPSRHLLISVMTGVTISSMRERVGHDIAIVRVMPNTAIAVRESMTCMASDADDSAVLERAREIFSAVGTVMLLDEEMMTSATALAACGIAFFLRAIRAASQGGIEIGFHAHDALQMAAQTAKGAASLLLARGGHPEDEIDRVTTPRGCTIAGLNQMEHEGFSSAMIKGITASARMAEAVYRE